jgi:pimeloyl-ACP methyl ester carboxylesterase
MISSLSLPRNHRTQGKKKKKKKKKESGVTKLTLPIYLQPKLYLLTMTLTYATIPLQVKGVSLQIAAVYHNINSSKPPVLFLHGFGSCKEDLADIAVRPDFHEYGFLAFDAPGCGHSHCDTLSATDIPFLVETTEAVLRHFRVQQFHLIGHSMGGLTALLLAHRNPARVRSFIDIKGNLAPEDCFLSRQIFLFPSDDPEVFLEAFMMRTATAQSYGSPLYASTLRARVRVAAVRPIFESMVRLSDEADLLGMFLALPFPKMFMFGEENRSLSYLPRLEKEGVELAQIRESGHFPMYSNPVEMYRRMASFLQRLP